MFVTYLEHVCLIDRQSHLWFYKAIDQVCYGSKKHQNIVSIICHCESRALSENSARYDVTQYVTMF